LGSKVRKINTVMIYYILKFKLYGGILMVLVKDEKFQETLDLMRQKIELPETFLALQKWLKEAYSVIAVNFEFKIMEHNNQIGRYQLYIFLASTDAYKSMLYTENGYDKDKQTQISRKFYELASEYSFDSEDHIKDVWISYIDFSVELKTYTNRLAFIEAEPYLRQKYRGIPIWNIYTMYRSVIVFFDNDSDIKKYSELGICKNMQADYFRILKTCDEFDVYSPETFVMNFDSKENLDKNYEGNLYYYFK